MILTLQLLEERILKRSEPWWLSHFPCEGERPILVITPLRRRWQVY